MKKLLTILLTLVFVFSLGACNSAPETDYVTREEFIELQEQVEAQQDYLSRMVWQGYMLPEGDIDVNGNEIFYMSVLGFEYLTKTEKDYLNKSKFPDYIWDEFDNYVDIDTLGDLLTQKYFGVNSESTLGFQYKIKIYKPDEMTQDDFVTRLCMMIMELSEYDFYSLDSTELYLQLNEGASSHMKVRMSLLTTDKYNLHAGMFWNGLMDTDIQGLGYNIATVEALYEQYEADETFTGYVLDFK